MVGLDQTSWPRLETDATKPWQMWALTSPDAVVHRVRDDKSAATYGALVGTYRGVIIADARGTHEAGARASPYIVLAGCWAPVYRRFERAAPDHSDASRALAWIGALYELDRTAGDDAERALAWIGTLYELDRQRVTTRRARSRGSVRCTSSIAQRVTTRRARSRGSVRCTSSIAPAGDDASRRGELRRANAPAILNELKAWLWVQAEIKTLSIGRASAYTLGIWDRLTRLVDDARIPLDNNATERSIRGPRRRPQEWLRLALAQRHRGRVAALYDLETCKLHDVDPAA